MARFKYIDTNSRFLAVDLAKQLLPGTFEHALNHLLDGAIDLSHVTAPSGRSIPTLRNNCAPVPSSFLAARKSIVYEDFPSSVSARDTSSVFRQESNELMRTLPRRNISR